MDEGSAWHRVLYASAFAAAIMIAYVGGFMLLVADVVWNEGHVMAAMPEWMASGLDTMYRPVVELVLLING